MLFFFFYYFIISFLITKTAVCHPSKKRKEKKRERFDHVILSLLEVGGLDFDMLSKNDLCS